MHGGSLLLLLLPGTIAYPIAHPERQPPVNETLQSSGRRSAEAEVKPSDVKTSGRNAFGAWQVRPRSPCSPRVSASGLASLSTPGTQRRVSID